MTTWDTTLLSVLGDGFYGLSQHLFFDETLLRGMDATLASIQLLDQQIAASGKNVRHLIGDHAHSIPNTPGGGPSIPPDYAMQWQAAVTTADFLLALSQNGAIERANFWIYGSTAATWHPIRRNADGSYTMMAVAQMHEILGTLMTGAAVRTLVSAPPGSDGMSYSVRASAFSSGAGFAVVVVNRDPLLNHDVLVTGGGIFAQARLAAGAALNADQFTLIDLAAVPGQSVFHVPANSILVLQ
jgi:hypothetical protein